MAAHWGRTLPFGNSVTRIEDANLAGATVVAVVSRPLADELAARGVDPAKVVVAPNGVDLDRFRPDAPATPLPGDGPVIGFSGSFGRWHGAEVLARAFVRLSAEWLPEDGPSPRLAMIGAGETLPAVRAIVAASASADRVLFPGAVPPDAMPGMLAACDVLASPQVANPDGSEFFGSPTKLFEYMAMGRATVASRLGQIAQIVEDGGNGLLVPPGDEMALAAALAQLCRDAGRRRRLGERARADMVARHGWDIHVRLILDAVRRHCGGAR